MSGSISTIGRPPGETGAALPDSDRVSASTSDMPDSGDTTMAYVANSGNGTVVAINGSGTPTLVAKGLFTPVGVALSRAGDVHVADMSGGANYGAVYQISADGQSQSLHLDVAMAAGLCFDASDSLYVRPWSGTEIVKVTKDGDVSVIDPGDARLGDITLDNQGNIYGPDLEQQRIVRITPNGTVSTIAPAGTGQYSALTLDRAGNIFAAHTDGITRFGIDGSRQSLTLAGIGAVGDLAFDPTGNLLITDFSNGILWSRSPVGDLRPIAVGLAKPTGCFIPDVPLPNPHPENVSSSPATSG